MTAVRIAESLTTSLPAPVPGHRADPVEIAPQGQVVQLPAQRSAGTSVVELTDEWSDWSARTGAALLPLLDELNRQMPSLTSAMICTADGLNLCGLGIAAESVDRVSALTSSLHSIVGALSRAVQPGTADGLDVVSLGNGASQTVVVAVKGVSCGQLLVWVTAEKVTLGVLLVRARAVAEKIRQELSDQ